MIISELAKSSVKNRGRSSAVFYSVLIAVIILGTLLFIYSELELGQWNYHRKMFGDYHAILYDINEEEYELLQKNASIKMMEPSKVIQIENVPFHRPNVVFYQQSPILFDTCSGLIESQLVEGRLPQQSNEVLASNTFVFENPSYSLGKTIRLGDKDYQICGVYKYQLLSFDKNYLFYGQLASNDSENLFQGDSDGVFATIWFKNERDTYSSMRQILRDLGRKDEDTLLKEGTLNYNTEYLEGKLIFKSGLIPSRGFVERWSLRVGLLGCVLVLFAVMIYNAFNVWNNQELRQIGLLKSSGMTPGQMHRLVIEKALRLSLLPILLGLVLSYLFANLLFYLMWLNSINVHLPFQPQQFKMVTPNLTVFIVLFILALLCVLLAALKPAKQSSKLSVIESLKGVRVYTRRVRLHRNKNDRNVIRGLAKDNAISYQHTFRGLSLAMALSVLIFSTVLIVQSYRDLNDKYNKADSPYTLTSTLYTIERAPRSLLADLELIPEIDAVHILVSYDFEYMQSENQGFISDQLRDSLQDSGRDYHPRVTVYALADADFQTILAEHGFNPSKQEGFLLLDRIAQNPNKAYMYRKYIPLSRDTADSITVLDNKDRERYNLTIAGRIERFPFDLNPMLPDQIALFTSLTNLEDFLFANDKVDEENPLVYRVKVKADLEVLPQVTEEVRKVLNKHVPSSDAYTRNLLADLAAKKEQYRNELLLTIGAQVVFMIIGFSNAYNSFHINLQTRTRDFALLKSVGMTAKQIKKMLHYETWFIIRRVILYYVLMLVGGVFVVSAMKEFMFSPWQLALNINYPLLVLFFLISILGIWGAMENGVRKISDQSIITALREE
ncbi:MAG TPA: ABC transporter permease [Fervidobacterium sp.]|jgi:putative ABC transport system permease protein|nr:ABC transporter permease [Bacillota bacterium]HPQ11057.1 ABC transporter permease [Bacillota bacterium]HUM43361.1 ABC transporter permease [Fervidobacterium sp.]